MTRVGVLAFTALLLGCVGPVAQPEPAGCGSNSDCGPSNGLRMTFARPASSLSGSPAKISRTAEGSLTKT